MIENRRLWCPPSRMIPVEIIGRLSDATNWCDRYLERKDWTWYYPTTNAYDGRYWFYFKSLETAAEFKLRFG